MKSRIEDDSLGKKEINKDSLEGIHTLKAKDNFSINGNRVNRDLITAIAEVKKGAAIVNNAIGFISDEISNAIVSACNEIIDNTIHYRFDLPALQGGAGTSTNMNVNEVIANRALEILGEDRGDYSIIHPIETVNLHQSTNDVFPTALKITVIRKLRELSDTVAKLQGVLQHKEKEFSDVLCLSRTELQDAVPITMGAQFGSFAQAFERDRWRCFKAEERIRMVNIGGTAVGTGVTAPKKYIFRVIEKLREITGLPIGRSEHLMDATANSDDFVEVASILVSLASNLIKISRDIRYLHSINELTIPKFQAGSSIMPGKVNPVIIESVIQLAISAKGENYKLVESVSLGSLQINEYMPLIADSILSMISYLMDAVSLLVRTTEKITVNKAICERNLFTSTSIVTILVQYIGYGNAERIVNDFIDSGLEDFRVYLSQYYSPEELEHIFSPSQIMALGYKMSREKSDLFERLKK